jgi:hypothetical protein
MNHLPYKPKPPVPPEKTYKKYDNESLCLEEGMTLKEFREFSKDFPGDSTLYLSDNWASFDIDKSTIEEYTDEEYTRLMTKYYKDLEEYDIKYAYYINELKELKLEIDKELNVKF